MERQHQRALISCSSLAVAVEGPVVGVEGAGATLGFLVVVAVVVVRLGATLIISKSSSGSFGMFLSLSDDPFVPCVFAVVLYLARGAVAQAVLELDVHIVGDALIRYRRA